MIAFKVPNLEVDKSDKFFTHWCAPAVACPASAQAAYQVIHLPERVRRKPRPSLHRACVGPRQATGGCSKVLDPATVEIVYSTSRD